AWCAAFVSVGAVRSALKKAACLRLNFSAVAFITVHRLSSWRRHRDRCLPWYDARTATGAWAPAPARRRAPHGLWLPSRVQTAAASHPASVRPKMSGSPDRVKSKLGQPRVAWHGSASCMRTSRGRESPPGLVRPCAGGWALHRLRVTGRRRGRRVRVETEGAEPGGRLWDAHHGVGPRLVLAVERGGLRDIEPTRLRILRIVEPKAHVERVRGA